MWGPPAHAAPPPGDVVDWPAHHRFLADLFAVAVPQTFLDLTGGQAGVVITSLCSARPVAVGEKADLVLAQGRLPDPAAVTEEGLTIVALCPPVPDGVRHALLGNGLTVFAENGWDWLLSEVLVQWTAAYGQALQSDGADQVSGRLRELADVIETKDRQIELLEDQLLEARDEVARLLPLEVSPKAQVAALGRSVPVSIRKRIPRRRSRTPQAADTEVETQRQLVADLRLLKGRRLRALLADGYDENWTGQPLTEYLATGIRAGRAVSPAHAEALRAGPVAAREEFVWPASSLRLSDGTTRTGEIHELVEQAAPRLLTVDVWDTLVVRDRPADAAKLATVRRMLLRPGVLMADVFEAMAVRVDVEAQLAAADPMQEYELSDVLSRTAQRLGIQDPELVADLVAAEVADEIAFCRAREDVAGLQHPQRVIASDFYMRSEALGTVIRGVAPGFADVPVYVSVDKRASKRLGGALLELIRKEYAVPASEHLHIGDNVHADVDVQLAAGGNAIHVQRRDLFPGPGEFGRDDLAACSAQLRRMLADYQAEHPTDDIHEQAGRDAAPVAVALVAGALEQAYRSGGDRVHYVSREGLFLSQVHDLVEPILRPPGVPQVRPVHLALSRRATFGASLRSPYRFSLQRMWSMYAKQSVSAMLVSIGVDPRDFSEEMAAAGLSPDEVLTDARRDGRVEAFLADPRVEEKISSHVEAARSALRKYVESRTTTAEPFIVCDIGWRGTIQDNLVRALGIRSSIGVYLGLFPFLNAQPLGSRKVGVAFDGNADEEFEFADPPAVLERPWTPDVPSTIGFQTVDGEVVPVYEKEAGHVSSGIAAFQAGTFAVAQLTARWMSGFGLTTEILRPELAQWLKHLWLEPSSGLADIWFDSDHDDSFGALNSTSFGKVVPGPQWLDDDLARLVSDGMAASGWPAGYRAWAPVAAIIEMARLA